MTAITAPSCIPCAGAGRSKSAAGLAKSRRIHARNPRRLKHAVYSQIEGTIIFSVTAHAMATSLGYPGVLIRAACGKNGWGSIPLDMCFSMKSVCDSLGA
jgi:hypothetical protein